LAIAYVLVKILVKAICRRLTDSEMNVAEVIAWFGVDASILALTFSAGIDVPYIGKFTRQAAVVWYAILVACVLFSMLVYIAHLRWRKQDCARWRKGLKIGASLALAILFGLTPLLGALTVLVEIDHEQGCVVGLAAGCP